MYDSVRPLEVGGMFSVTDMQRSVGGHDKKSIFDAFQECFCSVVWAGSGRTAILVALEHAKQHGFRRLILPSYLCQSVINSSIASSLEIAYYRVNYDLKIDIEHVFRIADSRTLLYVVEYFGWPTADEVLSLNSGLTLIVDLSHSVSGHRLHFLSEQGCMVVASLRKTYPLPDGGVFACNSDIEAPKLLKYIPELNLVAMVLKSMYEADARLSKEIFLESSRVYEESLDKHYTVPYSMSILSRQASEHIPVDLGAKVRCDNYEYLSDRLSGLSKVRPMFSKRPSNVVPLCFPLLCERRDALKARLISKEIYPPVHWPLPAAVSANDFPVSHWLSGRELSLPCDFRYGRVEMDFVAKTVLAWEEDSNG